MSLDVYLHMKGSVRKAGSGIYVREYGQTRQLTRDEWDERFPGCEPVAVAEPEEVIMDGEVYSANITHNLNAMAEAAGIYLACWRPGEMLAPDIHAKIEEQAKAGNYHGPGGAYELESTLPVVHARDLIEPLREGLAKLRADRKYYEQFNAKNGWGLYEHFVPWVAQYLSACEEYPDAVVSVSR